MSLLTCDLTKEGPTVYEDKNAFGKLENSRSFLVNPLVLVLFYTPSAPG